MNVSNNTLPRANRHATQANLLHTATLPQPGSPPP